MKLLIAAAAFFSLTAHAHTTWLSPDFKIIHTSQPASKNTKRNAGPTDCRAHIAGIMCLVDPPTGENPEERPCLPGSEAYAAHFEALYDRSPAYLQKMYCSLVRINIEKEFFATAYAGVINDAAGNPVGAVMGMRKSFLDQPFTISHWSTWKEQLNFGGNPDSYDTDPSLPTIHSSSPDMLYYVVAHEFGHIFDFANALNRFRDCRYENDQWTGSCEPAPGSWSALGWKNLKGEAKEGNDFALRKSLCFYWCEGNFIDPSLARNVYDGLFSTNFISVYAASNPWDDFAETVAYHALHRELGATYGITLADGTYFDSMVHLNSPLMAAKIEYLEQLFRDGPRYPGQN